MKEEYVKNLQKNIKENAEQIYKHTRMLTKYCEAYKEDEGIYEISALIHIVAKLADKIFYDLSKSEN